ncbi:hypothetical protein PACTADRAFT_25347, partial [Pachysolen tannophilus NRRL Y-2460]
AIIGGGASGAVTLDILIKENSFEKIDLFERRSSPGGIWLLDEEADDLKIPPGATAAELDPAINIPVEVLKIKQGLGESIKLPRSFVRRQQRFTQTPAYAGIRTNIPEKFMTYSDKPNWKYLDKPDVDTLTTRDAVVNYIEDYIGPNKDHVTYNTTVEKINKIGDSYELYLRQETNTVNEDGEKFDVWWKENYDAIVIATGHYHIPKIPDIPGLKEVFNNYPEKIEHAKSYRNNEKYKSKTVIVVGSRASGADISNQIALVAKNVYNSRRTEYRFSPRQLSVAENAVTAPVISRYELTNDGFKVHFENGLVIVNPDYVIYGTGYSFSYPFVRDLYPNFTNGHVVNSFQHTFFKDDPLISTVGIPTDGLSFRIFEYQAVLVSRFYAGKIKLPSKEEQQKWLDQLYKKYGETRAFYTIGIEKAISYREDLTELGGGVAPLNGNGRPFPILTLAELEE